MHTYDDVVAAIGNTLLIKLKRGSEETGCTILGKAEFMNPGQSVKDRPGRQMILEAEKRGELRPGGLVVESTAGNTGSGVAGTPVDDQAAGRVRDEAVTGINGVAGRTGSPD